METGDRLIVNVSPVTTLNGVLVLVAFGQLVVKRLATTAAGMVRIMPDNRDYPTEEDSITKFHFGTLEHDDQIAVIGRMAA